MFIFLVSRMLGRTRRFYLVTSLQYKLIRNHTKEEGFKSVEKIGIFALLDYSVAIF